MRHISVDGGGSAWDEVLLNDDIVGVTATTGLTRWNAIVMV